MRSQIDKKNQGAINASPTPFQPSFLSEQLATRKSQQPVLNSSHNSCKQCLLRRFHLRVSLNSDDCFASLAQGSGLEWVRRVVDNTVVWSLGVSSYNPVDPVRFIRPSLFRRRRLYKYCMCKRDAWALLISHHVL